MTRKALLTLSLSFLFLAGRSQKLYNDKIQTKLGGNANSKVNAVIYLPPNFDKSKKYPLVIFTHGIGEKGTNVNKLYDTGLPRVLKSGYRPSFDFIMVAPQGTWFSVDPAWLPAILADAESRWNIDQDRIYLTGLSAGGWCVYGSQLNLSADFAKKFAAIEINSGVNGSTNKNNFDWWKQSRTPVWAVVGAYDKVYLSQNTYMVNEINKRVPGLATLTVRPGIGHGNWDDVYSGKIKLNGKTMWEWLYQFKRNAPASDGNGNGNDNNNQGNGNGHGNGNGNSSGTPAPANKPPVAKAGSNQTITLPTSQTTLYGGGSDADGSIVKYKWEKISGPQSFSIANTNAVTTVVSKLTEGTYVFRLTATDNKGATGQDNMTVTVKRATTPKLMFWGTARADKNVVTLPANSATLIGSGTDLEGRIVKYEWTKISGPSSYSIANKSGARTEVSKLTLGTYVFRLTVTNNKGNEASDKVTITVRK